VKVVHSGAVCYFSGLLPAGFMRFTLCDVEVVRQFPCAEVITGDLGDISVIAEAWKKADGAQSESLPKALKAAYYLQSKVVLLERVTPAGFALSEKRLQEKGLFGLLVQSQDYKEIPLTQLMLCSHWPALKAEMISIAAVLDSIICSHSGAVAASSDFEAPETPWYDQPIADPKCDLCLQVSVSMVTLIDVDGSSFPFGFQAGSTISDVLQAHARLTGPLTVQLVSDDRGHFLPFNQVIEPGQAILVFLSKSGEGEHFSNRAPESESDRDAAPPSVGDVDMGPGRPDGILSPLPVPNVAAAGESGLLPRMPDETLQADLPSDVKSGALPTSVISPTAVWTQQCQPEGDSEFSASEQGKLPSLWGSVQALLGLTQQQFLRLSVPCIGDSAKLLSLRSQVVTINERIQLLDVQQGLWADDEIAFHLKQLVEQFCSLPKADPSMCLGTQSLPAAVPIASDELSLFQLLAADCQMLKDFVIGVFKWDKHWFPVLFLPAGDHDRIALIVEHGKDMGDDEIRFHLATLLKQRGDRILVGHEVLPIVLGFEGINFLNWDATGHIVTEKWCQSFPQVKEKGHQIVRGRAQTVSTKAVKFGQFAPVRIGKTRRWLMSLSVSDRAAYRKLLNGAHITQDAKHYCQESESDVCMYCPCVDSRFHRFWQCPSFQACREGVDDELFAALPELPECVTCYGWALRPTTCVEWYGFLHNIACPDLPVAPDVAGDMLHVFTDGSCCNPAYPEARFASYAVVTADPAMLQPARVLDCGPLPGLRQTSVRAELFAVHRVIRIAATYGLRVMIWSDCLSVVRRLRRIIGGARVKINSPNADLWLRIQNDLQEGSCEIHCTKVTAHRNLEEANTLLEEWCFQHNHFADRAAAHAQDLRPADFWDLLARHTAACVRVDAWNAQIQKVLLAVSKQVLEGVNNHEAEPESVPITSVPIQTWQPLPDLPVLPQGAVRWYGSSIVQSFAKVLREILRHSGVKV
ncbi:unnamed protein product, partial [Cladocopium goreaui]